MAGKGKQSKPVDPIIPGNRDAIRARRMTPHALPKRQVTDVPVNPSGVPTVSAPTGTSSAPVKADPSIQIVPSDSQQLNETAETGAANEQRSNELLTIFVKAIAWLVGFWIFMKLMKRLTRPNNFESKKRSWFQW